LASSQNTKKHNLREKTILVFLIYLDKTGSCSAKLFKPVANKTYCHQHWMLVVKHDLIILMIAQLMNGENASQNFQLTLKLIRRFSVNETEVMVF